MPFSAKTLDFIFENRLHDSRQWFNEHKPEYRALVVEPFARLVSDLAPDMLKNDGQFVTDPRVGRTICRIWRDTRYTKDPSLYRDSMWLIFKRDRMHSEDYPGIYFEIDGSGFHYGCGFYHASASYMNILRRMVLKQTPAFLAAQKAYTSQKMFTMEGECYKRPHFSDQPEALRNWLERRNIGFYADSKNFDLLFSDELAQTLKIDFKLLAPIYHLLLEAALENLQDRAQRQAIQR